MFKAGVAGHEPVEDHFAGVAEGGMAQVVGQGDGFSEVFVEAEDAGQGAGNLGDLDGVGQTGAVVVAFGVEKDLGLPFESTKGGTVEDAVAVALEAGAERVLRFGMLAAPGVGGGLGVGGQEGAFAVLPGDSIMQWADGHGVSWAWRCSQRTTASGRRR